MASPQSKEHLDSNQYDIMSGIAEEWWHPEGALSILQTFNDARVPFVCQQLEKMGKIKDANSPNALEGLKVLDVGCGGGILSEALAKLKATVVGIEPVDELINVAKIHASYEPKIAKFTTYLCETIEEHCVKNKETYDVIIASEVIEHVENKDSFLKSCAAALKKGGDIFFSCPNNTFMSYIFGKFLFELFKLIPRESHRIDWFIHHDDLAKKLEAYDIEIVELKGVVYVPIWRKWFIWKHPKVSYIMHLRKGD